MRSALLSVLVLALLHFPSLAELRDHTVASAPITIYTQFDGEYSDVTIEQMKEELAAIMGPIGLHFEWRSLNANHGNETSVELVVVSFKGKCVMEELIPDQVKSGPLGWTHMSDGKLLPFSDVDCDRIRKFIAPVLAAGERSSRDGLLGRAMGRVLAHELYHVFANTTRHASIGVAKAFYTANELLSDRFLFQEKESRVLRNGIVRSLIQNTGTASAGQ